MSISSYTMCQRGREHTTPLRQLSSTADGTEFKRRRLGLVHPEQSNQFDRPEELPTVLIAAGQELRASIVTALEADGYLVFEARSEAEALHIVISQTRSIHILLADMQMNGHRLAGILNLYRPEMRIFLIASHSRNFTDALNAADAVEKVREHLEVPENIRKKMLAGQKGSTSMIGILVRLEDSMTKEERNAVEPAQENLKSPRAVLHRSFQIVGGRRELQA